MISITCTNCKARLEMDDAFAGGVCRCRFCGTIQTVPDPARRRGAAATAGGAAGGASKAIYHKRPGGGGADVGISSGTGLDELAEAVASSGLGNGLGSGGLNRTPASPAIPSAEVLSYHTPRGGGGGAAAPSDRSRPLILGVMAGLVLAVVLGLVTWLFLRRSAPVAVTSPTAGGAVAPAIGGGTTPAGPAGPSFAGVSLAGAPSVVFVLDASQVNGEVLDTLKAAVYRSLESMGPGVKFQVIFWEHAGADDNVVYPEGVPAAATPEAVAECKRRLEDVVAFGNTRLDRALKLAAERRPAVIVVATAKGGLNMDEAETIAAAEAALGAANVQTKVHAFALGRGDANPALRQLAARFGGQYSEVPLAALRRFSR
jgi:hypothetical protein